MTIWKGPSTLYLVSKSIWYFIMIKRTRFPLIGIWSRILLNNFQRETKLTMSLVSLLIGIVCKRGLTFVMSL